MKKILAILLLVIMVLAMVGCEAATVEKESQKESTEESTSMFVLVETASTWRIVYHRESKVMYAVSNGGYNTGTFTLLVDADGKPMIWKNEK